jgi:hypothetical protein
MKSGVTATFAVALRVTWSAWFTHNGSTERVDRVAVFACTAGRVVASYAF